jgi:KaiC/GvpD/RAD55 family RecA-like ATPase
MNTQRTENMTRQTIQVKKLRGVEHSKRIHEIELGTDGLNIFES